MRLITNYHHKPSGLNLRKTNLIYCQLKYVWILRNKDKLKQNLPPTSRFPQFSFAPSPTLTFGLTGLFLTLFSSPLTAVPRFARFLHIFCRHREARLCPVAGSVPRPLQPAASGMGQPWPRLTETTPAALPLPKRGYLPPTQPAMLAKMNIYPTYSNAFTAVTPRTVLTLLNYCHYQKPL